MSELSTIARNLATARSLPDGVIQLQHDMRRLLHATDALLLWVDWARGAVWSVNGPANDQVRDLVLAVAGSGKPEVMGNAMLQPIGTRPARTVLGMRRPSGASFDASELAMISTLAIGIAPSLDRLIASR